MQEKTISVAAASAAVGLNIYKGKNKILRYNTTCNNPIIIDREDLEDVKTFTYLDSIIDEQGGSDADVKAWVGKARALSTQNTSDPLTKHYQQQRTVGENKPDPSGGRNLEEALEMVVGGSRQETLDPGFVLLGTHQQGVPVFLRDLVLPGEFDLVSPTELSGPQLTSSRTVM
ncbi:unnamed protein product [Schistosoma curassoni]|uniref:Uncharacterized protein n=1 Tax=Schistosoma curassoni TaxID=6186 RepID=A0A183K1X5_9TREM|nr:unnamed protein product [Schistosoma curassoni]